jgi:hypothetical protein
MNKVLHRLLIAQRSLLTASLSARLAKVVQLQKTHPDV